MARLIQVPTFVDERGTLSVLDSELPFPIKRVFYIYGVKAARGGHGHFKTKLAMICLGGSVRVKIVNKESKLKEQIDLDNPSQCLILEPNDWHLMDSFTSGASLLVLASESYDREDYFYDEPQF